MEASITRTIQAFKARGLSHMDGGLAQASKGAKVKAKGPSKMKNVALSLSLPFDKKATHFLSYVSPNVAQA